MLYTFHYYEPFQFTHQGASWNAARHLADVPYPAQARPLRDSLDATAAAIDASTLSQPQKVLARLEARRLLESYRRSGFDRAAMARSLDRIGAWARSNGVPGNRILLGEFGALKSPRQAHGVRAAERRQWFADVRAEAEARGFSWAVWVYRLGGFEVVSGDRGVDVDPAIVEALGLTARARHSAAPKHIAARQHSTTSRTNVHRYSDTRGAAIKINCVCNASYARKLTNQISTLRDLWQFRFASRQKQRCGNFRRVEAPRKC